MYSKHNVKPNYADEIKSDDEFSFEELEEEVSISTNKSTTKSTSGNSRTISKTSSRPENKAKSKANGTNENKTIDNDSMDIGEDINHTNSTNAQPSEKANTQSETFPPELMVRIMSEFAFKNQDTEMTAQALDAVTEYIRIFTTETIWRSEQALSEEEGALKIKNGGHKEEEEEEEPRIIQERHLHKALQDVLLDF